MKKQRRKLLSRAILAITVILTAFALARTAGPAPIVRAAPFLGPPNYTSGFVGLGQNASQSVTHDLGGNIDDYLVLLDCKDSGGEVTPGPLYFDTGPTTDGFRFGTSGVTANTAQLHRATNDTLCNAGVRIRIWSSPPAPNYNSGFVAVAQGASQTVNHGLGGNRDDYLVIVDCKDSSGEITPGPQFYTTGATRQGFSIGPDGVTASAAQLNRALNDTYCDGGVRIRIWSAPPAADYNSGFIGLGPGANQTVNHDLGGNRDDYLVFVDCKGGPSAGVIAGPVYFYEGANVRGFRIGPAGVTTSTAQLQRATNDAYCDTGVRVRIWPSTAPATPTPTPTVTATATATVTATPTVTATTPPGGGQWFDRPPGASGAAQGCPGSGLWVLGYWGGADGTAIASAAGACPSADRYWVSRQGTWMGYASSAPAASDTWNVIAGEAHFIHAP